MKIVRAVLKLSGTRDGHITFTVPIGTEFAIDLDSKFEAVVPCPCRGTLMRFIAVEYNAYGDCLPYECLELVQ